MFFFVRYSCAGALCYKLIDLLCVLPISITRSLFCVGCCRIAFHSLIFLLTATIVSNSPCFSRRIVGHMAFAFTHLPIAKVYCKWSPTSEYGIFIFLQPKDCNFTFAYKWSNWHFNDLIQLIYNLLSNSIVTTCFTHTHTATVYEYLLSTASLSQPIGPGEWYYFSPSYK